MLPRDHCERLLGIALRGLRDETRRVPPVSNESAILEIGEQTG